MADNPGIARIVRELPAILGGALGTTISMQTGDPVMGGTIGQVFTGIGADFVDRVLSPRQADRIEKVLELAARDVREQIEAGELPPADGLLSRGDRDAKEIVEGVLLAARDEHEEKKLPYLGKQLANIASATGLDVDTAHRLIQDAEALSWLELRMLAMVAQPEAFPLPGSGTGGHAATWPEETVVNTFRSLEEKGYLFSNRQPSAGAGKYDIPSFDLTPAGKRLTRRGHLLAMTMGLAAIPDDEIRDIQETVVLVWTRGTA